MASEEVRANARDTFILGLQEIFPGESGARRFVTGEFWRRSAVAAVLGGFVGALYTEPSPRAIHLVIGRLPLRGPSFVRFRRHLCLWTKELPDLETKGQCKLGEVVDGDAISDRGAVCAHETRHFWYGSIFIAPTPFLLANKCQVASLRCKLDSRSPAFGVTHRERPAAAPTGSPLHLLVAPWVLRHEGMGSV